MSTLPNLEIWQNMHIALKPPDTASIILGSNFIEGVQSPHVKNKLRSYQVKNMKDIFGQAIHKDQRQK